MRTMLLAIAIPPLLLLCWVLVQNAWRRQFGRPADEDVLHGRGGCGDCGCAASCERQPD